MAETKTESESKTQLNSGCHVAVAMETSSSSSILASEPTPFSCRICLEESKIEELVSPCSCSGSCALVHSSCLKRWLKNRVKLPGHSFSYNCEICKSPYSLKVTHIPRTFKEYCQDKDERGDVINDVITMFIFTIVSLTAFIITVMHVVKFIKENQVIAAGLCLIFLLVLLVGFVWTCTLMKYHKIRWKKWSRENPQVDFDFDLDVGQKLENQVDDSRNSGRNSIESGNHFLQENFNDSSNEALEETGTSLSLSEYINHCFELHETEIV